VLFGLGVRDYGAMEKGCFVVLRTSCFLRGQSQVDGSRERHRGIEGLGAIRLHVRVDG
jgi:hypothetical protein